MVYIDHPSTNANFNFALEKYAMEALDIADEYFMFWRTAPTLMIGRFQNTLAEINMDFAQKHHINIVRRISGGGTIYTDMGGWQFSFISRKPDNQTIDFSRYTEPIIQALSSIGVSACLSGRNDLLIDGKKFSGNAQYKTTRASLHHGSILFDTDLDNLVRALNVDDEKIIAKGIKSVRQRVCNVAEYLPKRMTSEAFRDVMIEFLTKDIARYRLTPNDIAAVEQIQAAQFDTWEWNFGKSPEFSQKKEARYAGGRLSVCTMVENGVILDIAFYGDFFARDDLEKLRTELVGVRHQTDAVRRALVSADAGRFFHQISLDEILALII